MNFVGVFFISICITIPLNSVLASSLYRRSDEENICETDICKESATLLQNAMNQSVDPCTDFFEYACGGWIASHPIPPSEPKYTAIEDLKVKVFEQVKDVLLTPPVKPTYSKSVANTQTLYKGCLDEGTREKEGVQPVKELINEYGGWPLLNLGEWDGSTYKWSDVTARLIRKFFLDAFFMIFPLADDENPDYNIIFIEQPGFQAGRKEMLKMTRNDRTMKIIAAYKTYITKSAELLGAEVNDDLKQAVDDLVNFESEIAKCTKSFQQRITSDSLYNKMTIAELKKNISDAIDWKTFFNILLEGLDPVEESTEVVLMAVDYLQKVFLLVKDTEIKTVANYIGWKLVSKVGVGSTAAFRDDEFQFDKVVKGVEEPQPLEKICVDKTIEVLGYAAGRLYVEKYFGNEAKADIEKLVENLRKAYKQTLSDTTWMDEATRKEAIEKLEILTPMLAYPDWILDDKKLDEYYEDVPELSDKAYFKSLMAAINAQNTKRFKNWNKESNRTIDWVSPPPVVDAFFYIMGNTITFPAGILNYPFYQYNRLPSMNYAAIGMTVGHEMSHAFDVQGSQYDKNGLLRDWWTKETWDNFSKKAKCFKQQYKSYVEPITGLNLNGGNAIGENIADNGAIRNAYKAYKLYLQETGNAPQRLPNINATSDQLFFLSFASIFCGSERKESLQRTIQYDAHTPEKYRVLVPLSNSEDFSKAFNCDEGTPMNPADKCVLW